MTCYDFVIISNYMPAYLNCALHYKLFVLAQVICRSLFLMVVTINSSVLLERGELHDNSTDNEGGLAGLASRGECLDGNSSL